MDLNNPMTRLTGTDKPQPGKLELRAGVLRCIYESGMIRYVSSGNYELIRCIYSAVRDRNWGTMVPMITNERIHKTERSFTISCHVIYKDAAIHFEAGYSIEGTEDNRIVLRMKGRAVNTFLKNRIGYCILHPLQGTKGLACTVTGPDGQVTSTAFPVQVSPGSPMMNISSLEWQNDAARCRISFEGDTWEMEDHRNWTDSSFKTFCTPLALPYPVTITAGTEVEQTITLEVLPLVHHKQEAERKIRIRPGKARFVLPSIGTSLRADVLFTTKEADILKTAGLHHLRFDLKFSDPAWQLLYETAVSNTAAIGAKLELVIHFSERVAEEIAILQAAFLRKNRNVYRVLTIHEKSRISDDKLLQLVIPPLKRLFPGAQVGAGTDAYFAEFNRCRFDAHIIDFVSFAISPQVHAFDNGSLAENMEAQGDVIESARIIYPGKAVQVSPITLRQRFNVVATGKETPVPEDQLPYPVDERQMSMFAAGWTLGSMAALAQGGADAVTYYEATGWRGLIQGDADPEKPALFAGRKGDIFPVFHILRLMNLDKHAKIIPCSTLPALYCTAVAFVQDKQMMLVVANHTQDKLPVLIEGFEPDDYAVWDSSNLEQSFNDAAFLDHLAFNKTNDSTIAVEPFSFLLLRRNQT